MQYRDRSYLNYQRNTELVRLCLSLAEAKLSRGEIVKMNTIAQEVANRPSSRFWVSEDRAKAVMYSWITHEKTGDPYPLYADPEKMHPLHKDMYNEIFARYKILRQKHPDWSHIEIVRRVINSPAPSFYLTPYSIKVYFYKHRKYEKQKSKGNMQ